MTLELYHDYIYCDSVSILELVYVCSSYIIITIPDRSVCECRNEILTYLSNAKLGIKILRVNAIQS